MIRSRRVRAALVVTGAVLTAGVSAFGQPPKPKSYEELYPYREYPASNDVKPLPWVPIPDDPPPHEGAMIDVEYVIEPPDLMIVEVLEALPGRPISGERLVRPDGTISLGFYGDIHVRGLTTTQAKVKIVEHLRRFLPEEVLGLWEYNPGGAGEVGDAPPQAAKPPLPVPLQGNPPSDQKPHKDEGKGPKNDPAKPDRVKPSAYRKGGTRPVRLRRVSQEPEPAQAPIPKIEVPIGGNIKITIEVHAPEKPAEPPPPAPEAPAQEAVTHVPPASSSRIFVDVTAYNHAYYFVQGDVAKPGKIPITGNETVLDAINYSGGLIATADPKNIRLVRPAHGVKPAKVYPVDLQAITEKGDPTTNYQVFPGDRVVVGRDALVRSTIAVDRLAAEQQTITNSMMQLAFMARTLATATPDLTPAQREALAKEWFDLYWKAAHQPGGPVPDENTYRELFLRLMKPAEAPNPKK